MAATNAEQKRAAAAGKRIPFTDLANADLYVDAIYEGGTAGTFGDDPISLLLPCGNRGGFRVATPTAATRVARSLTQPRLLRVSAAA